MEIVVVTNTISLDKVRQLAQESYGDMVKAVADIEKNILAIGGEFHADAEQLLLSQGSEQVNLWGLTFIRISLRKLGWNITLLLMCDLD